MNKTQLPWIEKGYTVFAYEGPQALKVERLASAIGKNKSSFYHHFADLELFTEALLTYHMEQALIMAEKEAKCRSMEELIDVLVAHKSDLLFNRQLRIHRENKAFESCFNNTNEVTAKHILGIWAAALGLTDESYLAGLVLKLSIENFFLQITDETLNVPWLTSYFNELKTLVKEFKKMGSLKALDGSV